MVGQRNGSQQDIKDALALADDGIVPLVNNIDISGTDDVLDKLKGGTVSGRQVITFG